ncbi:secretin and TonB N-terminal domain-containing protein [Microbacteriaceae bacterium K1510]|nr:secretin and TonB N-terminal domain-containing protein [Microbacteriaceae bacterium K1510]
MLALSPIGGAKAYERYVNFDLAAQPLGSALVEFANRTGMTALIDGELANGLHSSSVKGRFSPADALQVLLAGTGLAIRYVGANAFTVGPLTNPAVGNPQVRSTHRSDESAYFAELQNSVERTLCRNDDTRLGVYRAAFQVWIEETGRIRALHLLGTTGNESLDAAIVTRITNDTVAPPPRDLPQPITIILRAESLNRGCSRSAGARP